MSDVMQPRPGYCIERVLAGGRWTNAHQCTRKARYDGGSHCHQHSEAGVEARRTAWERRYAEDRARADALDHKRAEDRRRAALFDEMLAALKSARDRLAAVTTPIAFSDLDAIILKAERGAP